jgi:uncharacterized protein (TIGR02678 family)
MSISTGQATISTTDDYDDVEPDVQADEAPAPRSRRAWAPEAGSETAATLRQLALQPWLLAGRNDDTIAAVRRNEAAVRDALSRLGWILIVERDVVRLRKSPPERPEAAAAAAPAPLTCSWFFLLVAAAESMAPRCGLAQLVTGARAAAAEAALPVTGDLTERRAIVAALKLLAVRGLVTPVEGNLDGFVRDENAPVLLAVRHTRLAHVIANAGSGDPSADPHNWLELVRAEPDPARRMRRRLVDDTCVHAIDLDDAEAAWLSRRVRGDDGGPLAAAFGLHLERRSEGAAFVVPDTAFRHARELGPLPFPVSGTIAHAALLLCDRASAHGQTEQTPGVGWRSLTATDVRTTLAEAAEAQSSGRGGWGRDLADDPELLASKVKELLVGLHLLRIEPASATALVDAQADGGEPGDAALWWFAPVTGRWAGMTELSAPAPAPAAAPPRGKSRPADPDLLTLDDGNAL